MLRIIHTLCTMLAALSTLLISGKRVVPDCYSTTASDYDGHHQTTVSGKTCVRWDKLNTDSAVDFPDATLFDAANFCRTVRSHIIWCYISGPNAWEICGINKCGDDVLTNCGQLSIETPTVLGRNIFFSFTPDTHDPNANLYWQRKSIGATTWSTLNLNYKFAQNQTQNTYHLVLTDSVKQDDEQNYRVHYYNETMRCRMETKILDLKGNSCGLVQLKSEKVIRNGTFEIEYYPPNNVLANPRNFHRQWQHYSNKKNAQLQLVKGRYEEKLEQSDKYVLTIYRFNDDMNGKYGVFCGNSLGYTNLVKVQIIDPPSLPIILGLQDIEKCTNCIVGEDKEMFSVSCEIHDGSRPLHVAMTIGNESFTPQLFNSTTYTALFILRRHHHMENVSFSVRNDALSSPLKTTAQVFVINSLPIKFNISGSVLNVTEGKRVHVDCLTENASNISWIELLSDGNVTRKQCPRASNCILSLDANVISKRRFICSIQCLTSSGRKHLTLNILDTVNNEVENDEKQKNNDQASHKLIIWIILGSCLLLVCIFVVVVLFVVIRKRRQNPKDKVREKRSKEQESDVENEQEHFGHSSKSKASNEQHFGSDNYKDPEHLSMERCNVYDTINMH